MTDAAQESGEITQNIAGVAQAAQLTSNNAQESQKTANDLAEMAAQLRGLVEQFKVDRGNAAAAGKDQPSLPSIAAHA